MMQNKIKCFFAKKSNQTATTPVKLKEKRRFHVTTSHVFALCFCAAALLCVLFAYWFMDFIKIGTQAAMKSYSQMKEDTEGKTYDFFYDLGYDKAEEAHHTTNNLSISVGTLESTSDLEVLKISDVAYETPDVENQGWFEELVKNVMGFFDGDMISWLEVPANGVFTVNLQAAEFIIDEEQQYVLIRVPEPELTQFSIDYENVEVLLFEKGGAFKDSAKYGSDKAIEQLQNAELTMMQNANNNQEFYKRARESTKMILSTLVKQLNPKMPDLRVEVEFMD